jgi:hypothetical protein
VHSHAAWHSYALSHHITGQSSNSPERASLMLYVITPNTGREVSWPHPSMVTAPSFHFQGFPGMDADVL